MKSIRFDLNNINDMARALNFDKKQFTKFNKGILEFPEFGFKTKTYGFPLELDFLPFKSFLKAHKFDQYKINQVIECLEQIGNRVYEIWDSIEEKFFLVTQEVFINFGISGELYETFSDLFFDLVNEFKLAAVKFYNFSIRKFATLTLEGLSNFNVVLQQCLKFIDQKTPQIKDLVLTNGQKFKEQAHDIYYSDKTFDQNFDLYSTVEDWQTQFFEACYGKTSNFKAGKTNYDFNDIIENHHYYMLYKIMGVEENISNDDLKSTYRKLVRRYHPDLNPSEEAKTRMVEINKAYEEIKKIRQFS